MIRGILALVLVALTVPVLGCARYPDPTAVIRPQSLPTRGERSVPTAPPAATPTPSPRPTAQRVFTAAELDRFAALYSDERDGSYVTTRRDDGRYYYRSDDRRWYGLADRVWFRSVEDLQVVFPGRVPAP